MTSYFSLIPELFLPLLQLLILHKYMKIFLGAGNNHVQEHIEWGIYYIFLLILTVLEISIFRPICYYSGTSF